MTAPCIGCGMSVDDDGNLVLGVVSQAWPFAGDIGDTDEGGQIFCDPDTGDLWSWPRSLAYGQINTMAAWGTINTSAYAGDGVEVAAAAASTNFAITNPSANRTLRVVETYAPGLVRADGVKGFLIDTYIKRSVDSGAFATICDGFFDFRQNSGAVSQSWTENTFVDTHDISPGATRHIQLRPYYKLYRVGGYVNGTFQQAASPFSVAGSAR